MTSVSPRPVIHRLVVNARFLTQRITGVQRYAIEVSLRLKRLRGDIRFFAPQGVIHPDLARLLEVEVVGRLRGHAWEQVELPRYLGGAGLISLCNAAPLAVERQVVTIHDAAPFSVPEAYSRGFTLWYRFMTRRLSRHARRVITVSEFSAGEIYRHLGAAPGQVVVVPPGREHATRTPPDSGVLDRHGLRDQPFLLAVGSRSPHKNFSALVRAAERLAGALPARPLGDPSLLFAIAGGADPRVHAADAEGEDGPANLRRLGSVTDGELRALYEAATGYVHPAYYEGFGLPVLEAMTLGCPVLTSHAASLPEVCGEAACYFDPCDDADIADSVRRFAADDGLRGRLAQLGQQRAAAFSWDNTARGVLAVAEEALG